MSIQEHNHKKGGFSRWLRSVLARVKIFFPSAKKKETNISAEPIDHHEANMPKEDFMKLYEKISDPLMMPEMQEQLERATKFMYDSGRRDGALGIKSNNISKIANTHAQTLCGKVRLFVKGKLAEMQAVLASKQRIKEKAEQDKIRQEDYYDYLQFGYRYYPRTFSFSLFILYFIISIALFIADIPLALKLIYRGFDLKGSFNESNPMEAIFSDGNFWSNFLSNWELFFTAIGIALCSIYIKIFYDERIGTPYGNKLITTKKFFALFTQRKAEEKDVNLGLSNEEIQAIEKDSNGKSKWKKGILIFTLVTLIVLSLFRIYVLEKAATDHANIYALEKAAIDDPKGIFLWLAIIVLTIIFPIISGVCMSLSLTCLQNRIRFFSAWIGCGRKSRIFKKALATYTVDFKYHQLLEAQLEEWKDWNKILAQQEAALLLCYEYGYNLGLIEPERFAKGKDFFEKVEIWQQKMVSRKINSSIVKN